MTVKDHDGVACVVGNHVWYPDYPGQQWLGGTISQITMGSGNVGYVLHITPDGGGADILCGSLAAHHDPKPHNFPDAP